MRGKLVVTDLDGTLWGPSGELHPATRSALDELRLAGVPVLAATARRRASVQHAARRHGVELGGVLIDGALGYEVLDGEPFHLESLSAEQVAGMIATFDRFGYEPMFETDDALHDVIVGDSPSIPAEYFAAKPGHRCDLRQPLPLPVFSAVAIVKRDIAGALLAELVAAGLGRGWIDRSAVFPNTGVVKVRSPSCTKWSTLQKYCELKGIDPADVIAIGDDDNDVELLEMAGVGLAVATASPSACAAADHIVSASDDGGWASVLRYC